MAWPLVLSVFSGVLWFTAAADYDVWPLAWIAAVPVLIAIEGAESARRAALYAWVSGLVTNAGGFSWIVPFLERFAHVPTPVAGLLFLLLCAYQALVFLLFGWAVYRMRQRTAMPLALVAPLCMVTFELLVPFLFPWYLAITQASQPRVIQVADLTGPLGVTALLLMVGGAVHDLLFHRRVRAAAASAAILALALAYGQLRIDQTESSREAAPKAKVGVVQPNVAFNEKGLMQEELAEAQLGDLLRRSRELEGQGADLVIWSESAYPFWVPRPHTSPEAKSHGKAIRKFFQVPLVMGAMTYSDPNGHPHNSALMLDSKGEFPAAYDKIFLLLFGEYIPGLETFPSIRRIVPDAAGQNARGKDVVTFPFHLGDQVFRLGPMICYEDILPAFGRRLAPMHPHLLVNLTNDAWFGKTSEPWQHLALSAFRAVELRTDLVRAVNTGVSAYVDATGRVLAHTQSVDPGTDPRGAETILHEVALIEGGHTLYAAVGDIFGYACAAFCLGLSLVPHHQWSRRRRMRRNSP